jgi:Prokaryotic E2 family E
MTPLEGQFEILSRSAPGATLQKLPDGSHLVVVPAVELPIGWSKRTVAVKFLAPVGYPFAKLDCFWTDPDLRLASGANPMNTGTNPIPHAATPHLWFSWHVGSWNPNVDNLLTYLYVIRRRLNDPR